MAGINRHIGPLERHVHLARGHIAVPADYLELESGFLSGSSRFPHLIEPGALARRPNIHNFVSQGELDEHQRVLAAGIEPFTLAVSPRFDSEQHRTIESLEIGDPVTGVVVYAPIGSTDPPELDTPVTAKLFRGWFAGKEIVHPGASHSVMTFTFALDGPARTYHAPDINVIRFRDQQINISSQQLFIDDAAGPFIVPPIWSETGVPSMARALFISSGEFLIPTGGGDLREDIRWVVRADVQGDRVEIVYTGEIGDVGAGTQRPTNFAAVAAWYARVAALNPSAQNRISGTALVTDDPRAGVPSTHINTFTIFDPNVAGPSSGPDRRIIGNDSRPPYPDAWIDSGSPRLFTVRLELGGTMRIAQTGSGQTNSDQYALTFRHPVPGGGSVTVVINGRLNGNYSVSNVAAFDAFLNGLPDAPALPPIELVISDDDTIAPTT